MKKDGLSLRMSQRHVNLGAHSLHTPLAESPIKETPLVIFSIKCTQHKAQAKAAHMLYSNHPNIKALIIDLSKEHSTDSRWQPARKSQQKMTE